MGDGQQRVTYGFADSRHGVVWNAGERLDGDGGRTAEVHVRTGEDHNVTHSQSLGQFDEHWQARRQAGAAFNTLKPRRRHADQPSKHRTGQALALAEDLNAFTGAFAREVIKHKSPPDGLVRLLPAYAAHLS